VKWKRQWKLNMYVCMYIYKFYKNTLHTHTHTHIYIYIYIYILCSAYKWKST
jgi:hypothetical protein